VTYLSETLKATREYLNIELDEAAGAAGLAPDLLAELEAGTQEPDEMQLHKIARGYGVRIGYFQQDQEGSEQDALVALGRLSEQLSDADMEEAVRFATYLQFAIDP
jgi:transcriptional regulator with XRE-family HTH domain